MTALDAAYQRGLTAFIHAVEHVDPKDADAFHQALYLSVHFFGVRGVELTEHLKAGKSVVSKWVNRDTTPAEPMRERVLTWLVGRLRAQLREGVLTCEDVLRLRAVKMYRDDRCPERECDFCGKTYQGPALYCTLSCAQADA